jgi:hypothetical protein
VRGLGPRQVYDFFLQRAGPDASLRFCLQRFTAGQWYRYTSAASGEY